MNRMPPGMSLVLVALMFLDLNGGLCIAACPVHGRVHLARVRLIYL
jgi:hypothetical protein